MFINVFAINISILSYTLFPISSLYSVLISASIVSRISFYLILIESVGNVGNDPKVARTI